MSFFKFDETNASTAFELPKEGKYEALIINAEAGKSQAGNAKMNVDFEIRSDVAQEHQGAKILYNNFTFEHEVSVRIVNSLLKACGFAHNASFDSPEDMAKQLIGKNLIITVKHEDYEKTVDGQKQKRTAAKAKYYDQSNVNPPQSSGNDSFSGPVEVKESDLPF